MHNKIYPKLLLLCVVSLITVGCAANIQFGNQSSSEISPTVQIVTTENETQLTTDVVTTESNVTVETTEQSTTVETTEVSFNFEATKIETTIFDIFNGPETDDDETRKILSIIDQIHWGKYDKLTMDAKLDAYDLLYWLSTITLNDKELIAVLNATVGLDGGLSEGYSSVVSKLYISQPTEIIKIMSSMNEEKIDKLGFFIGYGCGNHNSEEFNKIVSDTKEFLLNDKFSQEEKEVIEKLIYYFLEIPR